MKRPLFLSYVNGKTILITILLLICATIYFSFNYYQQEKAFNQAITLIDNNTPNSLKKASSLLVKLAEQDHSAAQYRLAELLLETDKPAAMHWLTTLAKKNNPHGLELLGLTQLEQGNIKEGYLNLRNAAFQEQTSSQLFLALCFDMGDCGLPAETSLAIYWAQYAHRHGEAAAQLILDKYASQIGDLHQEIDEKVKHQELITALNQTMD